MSTIFHNKFMFRLCWRIVSAAKIGTIQTIVSFKNKDASTANDIRPLLLDILLNNEVTAEIRLIF